MEWLLGQKAAKDNGQRHVPGDGRMDYTYTTGYWGTFNVPAVGQQPRLSPNKKENNKQPSPPTEADEEGWC